MKIIAHRGNLNGPEPATENTIEQAEKCFALGLDVELDIWCVDGRFYLGHYEPQQPVFYPWLNDHARRLWLHCKNQEAAQELPHLNCFLHDKDPEVFTTKGSIWLYPGTEIKTTFGRNKPVVACLPELAPDWDISQATHICTDYPIMYREKYMRTVSQ